MKIIIKIYPFFIAIFHVLALYLSNINDVAFFSIFFPIFVLLFLTLILLLISKKVLKNQEKASIATTIVLFMILSEGYFNTFLKELTEYKPYIINHDSTIMAFWVYLYLYLVILVIRTKKNVNVLAKVLALASFSIVVAQSLNIAVYKMNTVKKSREIVLGKQDEVFNDFNKESDLNQLHDIYYIVIDRYNSAESLKEYFNYDNSKFIEFLQGSGFYVADKSTSNYLLTPYSLSSSLNLEYINYLSDQLGENSTDRLPLYELFKDYKVWRFLKSKGYTFIHFGSLYGPTIENDYADMNVNLNYLPKFSMVLFRTTLLNHIGFYLGMFDGRLTQWKRIKYQFDKLAQIPKLKEPTFVFAHLLITHPPYVFKKDGSFLLHEDVAQNPQDNYIDQIIVTNKFLRNLVDRLLEDSENPPIIILQSDEGTYPPRYQSDVQNFQWKKATQQELKEKTGILNAYYLPGIEKNLLYPSITPVNSFRIIFNQYFNENFELLPDRNFIHQDEKHRYKFTEVTEKLQPEN